MKITIIRPFKSPNDHPKANKKYAAIVNGDADGLVMNWKSRGLWLVGKIKNHALVYEDIKGHKDFVPWQFLGKPYYERMNDGSPRYIAGTVLFAATKDGIRLAFEEPFQIRNGDIEFERNACPQEIQGSNQRRSDPIGKNDGGCDFQKNIAAEGKAFME